MQKTYTRINWENYPSENTPINESNLNRTDYAINEIDDRVITLDTTKADVTDISTLVESVSVDDTTGVITLTKYNGTTTTIQTTLNKIAVNFAYDYSTQSLILTLNDGSTATISLSALIQNNEFSDSDTIAFTVSSAGMVSASVIEHSITDAHLRTDYLADIRVSEANADAYQQASEAFSLDSEAWSRGTRASVDVPSTDSTYQNNSKYYAGTSESWAVGERNGVAVPISDDTYNNNSKYYRQRAEAWAVGRINGAQVPNTDTCYENNSKYYSDLSASIRTSTQSIKDEAARLLQQATDRLTGLNIMINFSDGCMYYDINSGIRLVIDNTTGQLQYEIIT